MLSQQQRKTWRDNGFLVVPGFFDEAEVAHGLASYRQVWEEKPDDVVVDALSTGRRVRAVDLTDEEARKSLKVNDLYLRDAELRASLLSERLGRILRELLGDEPVICNTLSVEQGTQQPDHLDTLYMTPQTDGRLVATWMALEDVHEDAGPLRYYPESNHIEPYRFSNGTFHVNEAEMERWGDYMASEVERHGLAETRFLAKKGDLLIWDAWLLHGGSEICQPGMTRSSIITHYYGKSDVVSLGGDLRPAPGGHWLRRPPPALPVSVDQLAGEAPATPPPAGKRSLRERLALVDPRGD